MQFLAYLISPWTDVSRRQSSHGDSVPVLDGIRGLAVLLVLASHATAFGLQGQGSLGVFLFFTLSGFVLMLPFADRPDRIFQSRELLRYIANRALRIIPAFAVAVLVISHVIRETWTWVWINLCFLSGWNHLWSVAEEVRFYLLFPFVVAGLALLPTGSYRIAAMFFLVLAAWEFQGIHYVDLMIGASVPFYFFFFASGMLACLTCRALANVDLGYTADALAIILTLGVVYFIGWEYSALWCLLFFLLLITSANNTTSFTSRLFRSWFMRHIGLLSYGIYLFHVPVQLWLFPQGQLKGSMLFAVVFAATYLAAVASYLLVEKPFLMLKPRSMASLLPV